MRGNIFSTEHVNRKDYDANKFYSEFWNFTFHEIAIYDLPAIIQYVKGSTGFEKVTYIGHSQGTTMFYINFMMNPNYLPQHIDKFIALGNVLTVYYTTSPMAKLFEYTWFFNLFERIHIHNMFNLGTEVNRMIHLVCVLII